MREILTHNQDALLVPPEPEAFAEAMRRLAKDENLRCFMSEAAREKAQQYSIQRCAERFLEVYAGAVGKR
jgi:glycosyltransferase involved in cell wall biosynthesis